jgi:protocatechuate 3,4-dioxygenase beta subunit
MIGYSALGVGLLGVAACASDSGVTTTLGGAATTMGGATTAAGSGTTAAAGGGSGQCEVIPEETAGPYPGDGSNGPDVLVESGVVRSDIRTSIGAYSGTAEGVPLVIRFSLQDATNGCVPLAGAAVYAWHCDREGQYSLYTLTTENYLRGVQETDVDGIASFVTVFPGCYAGRWPHVHFEVFPSLAVATDDANKIATSQIALPEEPCTAVYATAGYEQSIINMGQVSLAGDGVFGEDGGVRQLGIATGSVETGYEVELVVPVSA